MRTYRGAVVMTFALAACKGESDHEAKPKKTVKESAATNEAEETETPAPASPEPTGPRYLRPDRKGKLVDAFRFPSVPASMVEEEVGATSTRRDAAAVLRRFGLSPLEGRTGEVWVAKASLVDRQARERVLVVSFRGDADEGGLRDEDAWLVFLGSTRDDRVLKIGSARIKAKTLADAPVAVDAVELHTRDADDVVATWSSCSKPMQKACHTLRAWTMQRGYPELIVDVTGDSRPVVTPGLSPPYDIRVDDRVLRFDEKAFAYK